MSRVEFRRTSGSLPISDFLSQLLCVRRNAFLSPPYIRAWMEGVEFTIRASGSVASHQSFLRVRFESSDSIGLAVMLFFSTFAFFIRREPARVSRVAWVEIFGRNHPKMSALWGSDTFFPSGYARKLRRRERLRFFVRFPFHDHGLWAVLITMIRCETASKFHFPSSSWCWSVRGSFLARRSEFTNLTIFQPLAPNHNLLNVLIDSQKIGLVNSRSQHLILSHSNLIILGPIWYGNFFLARFDLLPLTKTFLT